ncbi:uncharacterized protein BYT42DRAFT_3371 [Radiomyces spectabilis]|uniref:uncharacterized protein n=1 Tax=Radiomyces spectabilis TaxID=64574 RepID=UPI00221F06A5|nr:uncharacterized protein BYT42DRAFT_3371 [Radiomyces spectabilis]KAI8393350.1 hypothetical protein BYT42DRAFT_3371 [Radiomyces spectabilis]
MDNEVAKGRTQLVRRDSEGYLVREITMEDRMHMLEERQMMPEYDEAYAPDFHEEGFALENAYADENTFAEQEFMTGEDPAVVEDYLYDSGSFGTGSDDDERYTDEEGDHIMNQDTATICETDPLVERNDSPYTEKHDILSSTAGSDNCPGDSELPNNER